VTARETRTTGGADAAVVAARLRAAGCVFAEDEARLLLDAAAAPDELAALVDRRCAGEPLEHVLGWAWFRGRRIAVRPGVFVPRRRTEYLVELAVALARPADAVVDLCCGSGAIGASVAAAVPGIELHAADVDPAAVRCARDNVADLGWVHLGDLYSALPDRLRGRVRLLLVNAPYVPTPHIPLLPPEARLHEPRLAYDGGPDGLDIARRVSAQATRWLAPDGQLLVETSTAQAENLLAIVAGDGMAARIATDDERAATVVIGTRPA
jgi:release factor glutamine methyltransferase